LTGPSALGAKTMKEYGVEVFDAQGNFVGLAGVAGQLRTAFADLTEEERAAALNRIFGNESMNVANVLYKEGAAGVQEWTEKVDDSGFAAEQAAIKQDNLAGDVEKLGGAFDTAFIKTGAGANEVLRTMVQAATELVDIYGELPEPVQATALVLGVATAAALIFSAGAVGLRVKIIELKAQMDLANISFARTALLGGAAGLALTGVVAVVALLAQRQAEARQRAESYADTLEEGNLRITKSTKELATANLQAEQSFLFFERGSALDAAEQLGVTLDTAADAALGHADALKELSTITKAADGDEQALQKVMEETGLGRIEAINQIDLLVTGIRTEGDALNEARRLEEQKNKVTDEGVGVTKNAADAYIEASSGADDLTDSLQELIDLINEANGVGQDAITSNIDYQDALRQVDEQITNVNAGTEGYAKTLDITTEAGAANKQLLVDLAKDAQDAALAQFNLDGDTNRYRQTLESSRQALIDRAKDLGATEEEAQALADAIFKIPSETEWKIIADTQTARTQADGFIRDYSGRTIPMYVTQMRAPDGRPVNLGQFADGAVVEYYAGGGVRENHVAQMARGGAVRVWNEPETAGETYVPHAVSKRARSEQIMAETAAIFGGTYIPAGARRFADGDVVGAGRAAGGPLIGELHVHGTPGMNEDQLVRKAAQAAVEAVERLLQ
ncbi:phage tail tape measure protein, partial [Microbacterium sp. BR1]|uniref:phage tail tape measure protein n=1 Tax=Microbacterium sp. BR1 TaxID=1070896 RepID=UPI000C2B7488